MKRLFMLLLATAICFSFAGCFNEYEEKENTFNQNNSSASSGISIREEAAKRNENIQSIMGGSSYGGSNHTHRFSAATCTERAKCSCGVVDVNSKILGHNYSNATCTRAKTCSRCGKEAGSPLSHKYVNGRCTYCGKLNSSNSGGSYSGSYSGGSSGGGSYSGSYGGGSSGGSSSTAHTHSYSAATCTSPKKCSCGVTSGNALGHNFVNGVCSRCNATNRVYLIESIDYLSCVDVHYDVDRYTDNAGNQYSGHYTFYDYDLLSSPEYIEIQTNKQYSTFNGTIFLPYEERGTDKISTVNIYGDGRLLYQSKDITKLFKTENFSINIKGISVIKIEFTGLSYSNGHLTNAYLTK